MRIVFMGTPAYAATILQALAEQHQVAAVFTRPDAVRGRGKQLVPSPVRAVANALGIPSYTPASLRGPETLDALRALAPDCICVAAYGCILPQDVLGLPPLGCLNVHASLLPAWRGAAPVERSILAGDLETGVSIMRMEAGLDTGPYCVTRTTEVGAKNATELTAELADLGAAALLTALVQVEAGSVSWTAQDDFFATYAQKVGKGEFNLSPDQQAASAVRLVQASSAAHPSRCIVASRTVTVLAAAREPRRLARGAMHLAPGRMICFEKELYLGFSDQPVRVAQIKPDGKKAMAGRDFCAGVQNAKSGLVTWEALHG